MRNRRNRKRTNEQDKPGICRVPALTAGQVTASGSDGHDETQRGGEWRHETQQATARLTKNRWINIKLPWLYQRADPDGSLLLLCVLLF